MRTATTTTRSPAVSQGRSGLFGDADSFSTRDDHGRRCIHHRSSCPPNREIEGVQAEIEIHDDFSESADDDSDDTDDLTDDQGHDDRTKEK